ncbi:MAG: V-type ATP synthase subunit D [Aerococcus sp.]|nr:V-type ATP synthase subunit D [Aerococcus sp.]
MAKVKNVKPTRMELQKLRGTLDIAERGHDLLKNKQDELMRQFIPLARKTDQLRREVEKALSEALVNFSLATALTKRAFLEEVVSLPPQATELHVESDRIMNVVVPQMTFSNTEEDISEQERFAYSYLNTSSELDESVDVLLEVLPKLLELSENEKKVQLLAGEIEETRRRVNALEYRMIPDTEATINYIENRLAEGERSTKIRLMKVKDLTK